MDCFESIEYSFETFLDLTDIGQSSTVLDIAIQNILENGIFDFAQLENNTFRQITTLAVQFVIQ